MGMGKWILCILCVEMFIIREGTEPNDIRQELRGTIVIFLKSQVCEDKEPFISPVIMLFLSVLLQTHPPLFSNNSTDNRAKN